MYTQCGLKRALTAAATITGVRDKFTYKLKVRVVYKCFLFEFAGNDKVVYTINLVVSRLLTELDNSQLVLFRALLYIGNGCAMVTFPAGCYPLSCEQPFFLFCSWILSCVTMYFVSQSRVRSDSVQFFITSPTQLDSAFEGKYVHVAVMVKDKADDTYAIYSVNKNNKIFSDDDFGE